MALPGKRLSAISKPLDEDIPIEPTAAAAMAAAPEAVETAAAASTEEATPVAKDPLDALGDIVAERAPPSIDEQPAATAEDAAQDPAAAGEAEVNPEDEQIAELEKRIAAERGVSIEEARAILNREAKVNFLRQAGASRQQAERQADEEDKNGALQQAMRQQAGGGGGGGAIASLIGGAGSLLKGTFRLASDGVQKLRRTPVDNSPAAVRQRTFDHWYEGYSNSINSFEKAGSDLKKGVAEFNAAFLNTEAASRLRKMAEDSGQTLDSFMGDLNEGRNTSADAIAAAESAFADPRVKAAAEKMAGAEARAETAASSMTRLYDKIERNYSERIDPGLEAERMKSAVEDCKEGLTPPLYESKKKGGEDGKAAKEEQKKLMERMKEITDSIRRLVERILARFGLGPKS